MANKPEKPGALIKKSKMEGDCNMIQLKKPDKQSLLIFLLLLITVSAVSVTVWALFFRTTETVLTPDRAPAAEVHAKSIPGDSGKSADAEPGSGSVSLTYSNLVTIRLSSKTAQLHFANPSRSNQDLVLQLVIQDRVILQSGRITPGNQVTELDLPSEAAAMLMPGGYEGAFLLHFYHPSSGEKSIITTEFPVSVSVTE